MVGDWNSNLELSLLLESSLSWRYRLVWGESHCTMVALYVAKRTTKAEGIEPRAFWLWRQSVKLSATTVGDYMTERVEIRRTLDAMGPSSHRHHHRCCNLHHNIESSLRGMLIVYPQCSAHKSQLKNQRKVGITHKLQSCRRHKEVFGFKRKR